MSLQHIHVDLRQFPLKPGDRSERAYGLQVAPLSLGGQLYEVLLSEEGVVLGVERVAGGFLVAVTLTATLHGPCVRCLREVRVQASASEEEFAPTRGGDYEETEISPFIQDLVVDVAGLTREALILGCPPRSSVARTVRGCAHPAGRIFNRAPAGAKRCHRTPVGRGSGPEVGLLIVAAARFRKGLRLEIRAPMGYNLTALPEY